MEFPTSHYHNKNILVMVDHLIGWPIAKAIPDKEATTVAKAIFEKLILEHGAPQVLHSDNAKELTMIAWPMCVRSSTLNNILQVPTHPGQTERQRTSTKFLKASIRKLYQQDTAAWDQVLDQILFAYRCCPHTSMGEVPYTFLYNRDPPLPVQKLILCIEPYKEKRIETLSQGS